MAKSIHADVKTEAALEANQPVILIELDLSTPKYFTDNNEDITFDGNLYQAWGFSFDSIRSSLSGEVDRVNVRFDNTDLTFSTSYLRDFEFQGNDLTIKRVFYNQLGSGSAYEVILFKGKMSSPRVDEDLCTISVLSPFNRLKRIMPSRIYQHNCNWQFNGIECRGGGAPLIDESQGQITYDVGTPNSVTEFYDVDNRKDVAKEIDNYWKWGIIEFTSGALNGEKRTIKESEQSSGKIVITFPLSAVPTNENTYTIKRGCNKTSYWCKTKIENWINFGGFVGLIRRPESYKE